MIGVSYEKGSSPEFSDVVDELAQFLRRIESIVEILKFKDKHSRDNLLWP